MKRKKWRLRDKKISKLAASSEKETPEKRYDKYVKYINKWIEAEDDDYDDEKALLHKKGSQRRSDQQGDSNDIVDFF